jgi:hypothetical protein
MLKRTVVGNSAHDCLGLLERDMDLPDDVAAH